MQSIVSNFALNVLIVSMTKSQINYILAVAKLRNFGKAAESCFVTQSTLSAMIGKYEAQIGIKIFNRKTKPISITSEGEQILQQLKAIDREFNNLTERIHQIKGLQSGQLSIAAIPTVAPYIFPHILIKLADLYPEVRFTIQEMTTHRIIERIQSGDLDIGIVSTPLDIKDLQEYPLYKESFVIYDKRVQGHNKSKIKISEIEYDRLWLLEEGHCFRNQVEKICAFRQKKEVQNNITYRSGTIESLKKFVSENQGLTLLPFLSTHDLSPEEMNCIQYFHDPIPAREIGLITHKNFVKKTLLRGLERLIHEHLQPLLEEEFDAQVINPF